MHIIDTAVAERLTPEAVLATAGGDPEGLSVLMRGRAPMLRAFEASLSRAGVRPADIHRGYFNAR